MDYKKTPFVLLLLIALLGSGVFWFFNKQPLSENMQIRQATGEIMLSVTETFEVHPDENRTHWENETYTLSRTVGTTEMQSVISVLDEIQSRKQRTHNIGGVTVHGPSVYLLVSMEYRIDDRICHVVMTNERNIMTDLGSEPTVYTLQKGDIEKMASIIKQYGIKN